MLLALNRIATGSLAKHSLSLLFSSCSHLFDSSSSVNGKTSPLLYSLFYLSSEVIKRILVNR